MCAFFIKNKQKVFFQYFPLKLLKKNKLIHSGHFLPLKNTLIFKKKPKVIYL